MCKPVPTGTLGPSALAAASFVCSRDTAPDAAGVNVVAAHYPTTYPATLGLPSWLSAGDRQAATHVVGARSDFGNSIDPAYGPVGALPLSIDGSAGVEWLQGLNGGDRLRGGGGADILTSGGGADLLVSAGCGDSRAPAADANRNTDCSQTDDDRLDLGGLAGMLGGHRRFIASNGFDGTRPVRYGYVGGHTVVEIDLNGDHAAGMTIRLNGRVPLRATNYLL